MKTNNLSKKGFLVLVFAFAFLLFFQLGSSQVYAADPAVTARTINVTGDGEITAVPDIAYLYLGVTTEKTTTAQAVNANSNSINSIISAIKNEGIADEDIKTSNYSIYPNYDYDKTTGQSILSGYSVSQTLNVTVRNLDKVGLIIDTAVKNGANISNGVSFGVRDYEKYYNQALTNALSNALSKAHTISSFLNINLSVPVQITENSTGIPNDPVTIFNKSDSIDSAGSTSIQPGTYKIKASISVVYQY